MAQPPHNERSESQLLADARQIVLSEAAALTQVAERLDGAISAAINLIYRQTTPQAGGALVVSGLGKSGLAGERISASFASTGTPSHFVHPVEALHGDLGRIRRQDIAMLLSYGGETEELIRLLDHLKRFSTPTIAITAKNTSTLGRLADLCICLGALEEACPLRLAPTTSITCLGAVADALVLGVMSLRKFSAEDFAAFHPGGSLGRKLLKVKDAMSFKVGDNLQVLPTTLTLREALSRSTVSARRAGAMLLVDDDGTLAGIFTDGDLRRKLAEHADLLDMPMAAVMTPHPKRINAESLASEAMALFNRYRIDELPVVNEHNHPIGLIDVQDVMALRALE